MRITDPGVDTQIAQLALDQDGLVTDIVAFFDMDQARPSTKDSGLADKAKLRSRTRGENGGKFIRK